MKLQPLSSAPLAFVMAHRNTTGEADLTLLKRVISQLFKQTDKSWRLFVVDDHSSFSPALAYLQSLQEHYPDKIEIKKLPSQVGPGVARNHGIQMAAREGCPVVMFCDSDDLVHVERVKVTRSTFVASAAPTVLYSGFVAVDGTGVALERDEITPSLLEILDALAAGPPDGLDVWKQIGTQTGYVNLTSGTSVSTRTAILNPFPPESVSEDSHTWMRYSASGARYIFAGDIPVSYRTTRDGGGSASRQRDGLQFYYDKARVDTDGFQQAIALSELRGTTNRYSESKVLLSAFYVRLACTMLSENVPELTVELLDKAMAIDSETAAAQIEQHPELSGWQQQEAGWKAAA